MKKQKVVVGLSGGIDSSVTAYLLQKDGYEVEGIYMKLHELVPNYHEQNIQAIEKVTKFLNIKYHIIDMTKKFEEEVYDYFVQSYIDGTTPNPCVKCNRSIKFGALYEEAMKLDADFLATGHYAKTDGKFIYTADDMTKDQSYFLAQVDKKVLPNIIFPMSTYSKEEIKKIGANIPALKDISTKKESQEICFVENTYMDILKEHTNIDMPGDTLDKDGNIIGHHKGYMHYTVGKRKGFYVHGAHEPHYVLSQDKKNNTITVGKKDELVIYNVVINNLNMFIDDLEFKCSVKLRFRTYSVPCNVKIIDNKAYLVLEDSVQGVATGQAAVMYEDDKVIGSGWIIEAT